VKKQFLCIWIYLPITPEEASRGLILPSIEMSDGWCK
jgi:hypothetical protein